MVPAWCRGVGRRENPAPIGRSWQKLAEVGRSWGKLRTVGATPGRPASGLVKNRRSPWRHQSRTGSNQQETTAVHGQVRDAIESPFNLSFYLFILSNYLHYHYLNEGLDSKAATR